MKRRSFLNSILAAAATLPFVGRARAAGQSRELRERGAERELLIQESPVAGFQYHDGESVCPVSPRAIRLSFCASRPIVTTDGRSRCTGVESKLGYVPRAANTACSQMLDRGERLTARIRRLRESPDPWKRVELSIAARIAV